MVRLKILKRARTSVRVPWSFRASLVRYAGARVTSTDSLNGALPTAGLSGVIAHGMLTMGYRCAQLRATAGRPGAIVNYQTRFTGPVPVAHAPGGENFTPRTP